MEQRISWEADSSSTSQEIPRILCNLMVHDLIQRRPPPLRILSNLDPAQAPLSFINSHVNSDKLSVSKYDGFLPGKGYFLSNWQRATACCYEISYYSLYSNPAATNIYPTVSRVYRPSYRICFEQSPSWHFIVTKPQRKSPVLFLKKKKQQECTVFTGIPKLTHKKL